MGCNGSPPLAGTSEFRRQVSFLPGLLLSLVLVLGGCDAGGAMRLSVQVEALGTHDGGEERDFVRVFWFDNIDPALFERPLERSVRATVRERNGRAGYGIVQKHWAFAWLDGGGEASLVLETFYAGALFLPLRRLLRGSREEDPSGLWIEVHASPQRGGHVWRYAVLRDEEGEFRIHAVSESGGIPVLGECVGSLSRRGDWHWGVVLPRTAPEVVGDP